MPLQPQLAYVIPDEVWRVAHAARRRRALGAAGVLLRLKNLVRPALRAISLATRGAIDARSKGGVGCAPRFRARAWRFRARACHTWAGS
jgi:hypothetical protein